MSRELSELVLFLDDRGWQPPPHFSLGPPGLGSYHKLHVESYRCDSFVCVCVCVPAVANLRDFILFYLFLSSRDFKCQFRCNF